MQDIITIFTTEELAEMKQAIKNVIVDKVKEDLAELDEYVFDPKKIDDMVHEMIAEILAEIKYEVRDKIRAKVMASLDSKLEQL